MTFKSTTQPLCRYCGKPIPKRVITVYFNAGERGATGALDNTFWRTRNEKPRTKDEVQKLFNEKVVSVGYSGGFREEGEDDRYVMRAGLWDGETYEDEFFDKGTCATKFAYLMARDGKCTTIYLEALTAQKRKAKNG